MRHRRLVRSIGIIASVTLIASTMITTSHASPTPPSSAVQYDSYLVSLRPGSSAKQLDRLGDAAVAASGLGVRVANRRAEPTTETTERQITDRNAARGVTIVTDSQQVKVPLARPTADKRTPVDYDYIGKTGCLRNNKSYGADGWTKNHYAWCQVAGVVMTKRINQRVVATLRYRVVLEGRGSREARRMRLIQYFDQMTSTGQWAGGVKLNTFVDCMGTPSNDQCKITRGKEFWAHTGAVFNHSYAVTSGTKYSKKPDYKGYSVIQPWANAYDLTGGANALGYSQAFRCDSAKYTAYGQACIFHRVAGTLTYSRADTRVAAVAQHIYAAQTKPETTHPKWKGKTIPARLHRIYHDKKRRARNHDTAVKTCRKVWGKYDTKKKQCDEFPFQSTREGAAKGDRRYSARVLSRTQNAKAGSILGAWYSRDHIIDGDAFYIVIK